MEILSATVISQAVLKSCMDSNHVKWPKQLNNKHMQYYLYIINSILVNGWLLVHQSSGSRSHERPLRHSAMATTGRCVPVAAR